MIDAGIGETHVNNLLAALDIPPIHHKTLKKYERRIGVALEKSAGESCRRSLEEECGRSKTSTTSSNSSAFLTPSATNSATACSDLPNSPNVTNTSDDLSGTSLTATSASICSSASDLHDVFAADAGNGGEVCEPIASSLSSETLRKFQRRLQEGYDLHDPVFEAWKASQVACATSAEPTQEERIGGNSRDSTVGLTLAYDMGWQKRSRAMNSLTGVGEFIGTETDKVVAYGTLSKRCISCEVAERSKRPPYPHDCRRNHTGSSKSMEPAVAVKLAKSLTQHGAHVSCLVGDDDASTIKHLKDQVGPVAKQSDIGHTKRGLGNKLYDAKAKNKQCKQLSSMVITYVQKMFAYALQNNRGDAEGLKSTLLAITPHAFGDHTRCCETWCGYLKSPATYKHRGLPHGNDLNCAETRKTIAELLGGLADQADKLVPLASSQANESFNNIVAS